MKFSVADIQSMRAAQAMRFWGGSMPEAYGEYLRREKLRRRGVLRFWHRRSRRWDWNCYELTERGEALLRSFERSPIR